MIMSAQEFEDMRKLIENYKLDTIAQAFIPEYKITFETRDEEINQIRNEFFQIIEEFSKRKAFFFTQKGTLEWLDWIYRTLELESKMIRITGEKTIDKYDEETRWFVEFAVDVMVELIQRVQKNIRKESGLFKITRRDYSSIRQSVICMLANLTFSLFCIILAIIRIDKKEMKPQELYAVVADALRRIKF
jgi:enoyl reductase-like protein